MKLLFVLFILFALSCKEKNILSEKSTILYDEVMKIHDEVMPKMATIHTYKRDLKAIKAEKAKDLIKKQIEMLDIADEEMMNWMALLKLPEEQSLQIKYLESEKIKIAQIRLQMLNAIEKSKSLLDSLKAVK